MIESLKSFYALHKKYFFILGSLILLLLLGKLLFENTELIIDGIIAIKDADKSWVLLGLLVFFLGMPINALILIILSYVPISFLLTIKEQLALQFVNKLLPGGVGQLTLNSYYLHKEGNSKPQTASIVATKAMTASIAFLIMSIVFLIVNIQRLKSVANLISLEELSFDNLILILIILSISLILLIIFALKNKKIRGIISSPINNFRNEILKYKDQPFKLIYSILLAILATITGMFALWASSMAIGLELTYSEVFFIYSFGNFVAVIVPVPGGIGTTEVGLYAGFSILGYEPELFISAILIYRIINYWIPLVVGYFFFLNLRKNILSNFSIKYDKNVIAN